MGEFDGGRRAFLGTAAGAGALALTTGRAAAEPDAAAVEVEGEDRFEYEVRLSEEEWRERLTEDEYVVLREHLTELPGTSELWDNTVEGVYACRGCGLELYDSVWKVELDKGWAFFQQSREDTLLMGIDGRPPEGMMDASDSFGALIETHCRRCGCHMGHILTVEGQTLHCINGIALTFEAAAA